VSFRTWREVTGGDRSGLLEQVTAQRERIARRLRDVGRVVAVMSGKGGVGKTWVTASLAAGLAERGSRVGVLDADLKSPTAARLLGAAGPVAVRETGVEPATGRHGIRVFSMDLLLEEGKPLAWNEPAGERYLWRGALETGALREFLSDVAWGTLDVLLVDLPPGGDRLGDLAELVPGLAGAIAVSIPSEESRRSVERSMRGAADAGIRLLGVVENMSGYGCPHCNRQGPLFPGSAGADLAGQFGVPLLATIPFLPPGANHAEPAAQLAAAVLQVMT
jgi:ATP-binding protein involved in chromosome partitioning